MDLSAMLIADHRSVLRDMGPTPVVVGSGVSALEPVDAWVRDRGVCRLPSDVAEYADERGRYAIVRVEASLMTEEPASGSLVSFAGMEWQVRMVTLSGLPGAPALYTLHCVTAERSRGRNWGRS